MLGPAAAARPAVLLKSRIPVAPEEKRRIPQPPVAAHAQSGYRRRSLPAGAEQAALSSPPRFLAAGPASAFRAEAVGAFGEARVMVWVRRFRHDYAFKTAELWWQIKNASSAQLSGKYTR
jgi:hypothetical protein